MPGDLGQRARLSPARHAAVDKPRVHLEAIARPQPETLHDPRTKAFNQAVRVFEKPQHNVSAAFHLEIQGDRLLAAVHYRRIGKCESARV
jgi:hypothetical protein